MVPVTSTLPVGKFDSDVFSRAEIVVSTGAFTCVSIEVVEFQRTCDAAVAKREANKRKSQQRGAPATCRAACRVPPQPERRPAMTRPHQRGQGPR